MHSRIIHRIRRLAVERDTARLLETPHPGEVTIQPCSGKHAWKLSLSQSESTMQESTWSRRIYYKPRRDLDLIISGPALHPDLVIIFAKPAQIHLIEIRNSHPPRLTHQIGIEVSTVPVCISNAIVRTGCHQQLIVPLYGSQMSWRMMKKSETPFQSAG